MRQLVLMRGVAGCGKSTFLQQNNLTQYTLNADTIRLQLQSPILTTDGMSVISQKNDTTVWRYIFDTLKERMERGEFCIVDATHSRAQQINNYRKLASEYRYRVYVCDFSSVPLDVIKYQNNNRLNNPNEKYKYVPEHAIDNMYSRITTQAAPGWVTVFKPEQWSEYFGVYQPKDFSVYKKIHHIGDLHGCYTVLQNYLNQYSDGIIKEDEMYIFLGDYVDRGIENYELLNYLISLRDYKNVAFLEGNHELWTRYYANEEFVRIRSKEFTDNTMSQLFTLDKKLLREWVRRYGQLSYYKYQTINGELVVFANHGGIPVLPSSYIATNELVHGTGKYEEVDLVQTGWYNNTADNYYQIHGHRNMFEQVTNQTATRCFNLCSNVEFGGDLRVVTLDYTGFTIHEIPNPVFNKLKPITINTTNIPSDITVAELVTELRASKGVREKRFDPDGTSNQNGIISSFNFTSDVFFSGKFTAMEELARSLFINTKTNEIVIRAYPKWFKVNEKTKTKLTNLHTLNYPVTAYKKYNGFLGLVGYDSASETVVYATKSSLQGNYLEWFKQQFTLYQREAIEDFVRNSNYTLIFECIDPKNDPHIVENSFHCNILLDAVQRDMVYQKLPYDKLYELACGLTVTCKEKSIILYDYKQLFEFCTEIAEYNEELQIEGYVLEDSLGECIKAKTGYYNFWKYMRGIKDALANRRVIKSIDLTTALANDFVAWLKKCDPDYLKNNDIITLRKAYLTYKK